MPPHLRPCVPRQLFRDAWCTHVHARVERKTLRWNAFTLTFKPNEIAYTERLKDPRARPTKVSGALFKMTSCCLSILRSTHAQHGRAMQRLNPETVCSL